METFHSFIFFVCLLTNPLNYLIPILQGDVIGGSSFVDESMLTGESLPVAKETGLPVFAGTVNWVCI